LKDSKKYHKGIIMSRILIYNIAAEYGGSLAILNEYYQNAILDESNEYVFITSVIKLDSTNNVRSLAFPWSKKNLLLRLYFEIIYSSILVHKFEIDKVISLQNISLLITKKPVTIYFHQSLIFSKIKFPLFKNPKYWFYKNIYSHIVFMSFKKAKEIIVQTKWIKDIIISKGFETNKITINPPSKLINKGLFQNESYKSKTNGKKIFIYPTSGEAYKNFNILFESLIKIAAFELNDRFIFYITLEKNMNNITKKFFLEFTSLKLPVVFTGRIPNHRVIEILREGTLVFPSLVESFPIPLLEAVSLNRKIIVADLEYSREILENYDKAIFFDPMNSNSLLDNLVVDILS
jgi:glycosyltransferase involved in cell wall biosynthesis